MTLFYGSNVGHVWGRNWPWTALDSAWVPRVGRARRAHEERLQVYDRSQEWQGVWAMSQSKWIFRVLQVRGFHEGKNSSKGFSAPHECKSALHSSQPEGTSVRLHQFWLKQDITLYSYLLSFPLLTPSHLQSYTWERKLTGWRWRSRRIKRGNCGQVECAGSN